MEQLIVIGVAGFVAALIDGSLGMGYGPTSSSILLASGLSPVHAATSVNIAKVVTGLLGGAAHWRAGNVDRRLLRLLAPSGMAGAVVGATLLMTVDGDRLRPWLAAVLLVIGVRLLARFASSPEIPHGGERPTEIRGRTAAMAGWAGGVTNGVVGAWGPVVTPALLHAGAAPRMIVGTGNAAEVLVAVVAVGTLVSGTGGTGLDHGVLVAMLAGGAAAAPLAAHVARWLPPRLLGLAMAVLLIVTQVREVLLAPQREVILSVVIVVVAACGSAWRPRVRIVHERANVDR